MSESEILTAFDAIACPICDGTEFEALFEKKGAPIVQCLLCRLMLMKPRSPFSADPSIATADYSHGYLNKADKKRARCRRWVHRVMRRFVPSGRWLDVGCSVGCVVAAAEEAGFEAFGIEPEAAAVDYSRMALGLANLVCGTLDTQRYPARYFDVISLYDVLPHVADLNSTVAELARVLKPDGVIEIRTPDVGHWRISPTLDNWKEIKPSEHLVYFSAGTLQQLFARHRLRLRERRLMLKPTLDCIFVPAE